MNVKKLVHFQVRQRQTVHISEFGDQFWHQKGKRHRGGGKPAVIWANGTRWWYKRGKRHRDDGPAIVYFCGIMEWYRNGKKHRDGDKPAILSFNIYEWWKYGKRHRDGDKPAIISSDDRGQDRYYCDGEEHNPFSWVSTRVRDHYSYYLRR